MFHMREFVAKHTGEFPLVENSANPLGHRDSGMLGIAPGGKSVGGFFRDDINLRHRQSTPAGQLLNNTEELGVIVGGYFLRAVHFENDLVAEPVADEVHRAGEEQRHHRTIGAAEHLADPDDQGGQHRQKNCRAKTVHNFYSTSAFARYRTKRLG
jgi:hypothetical protein